MAERRGPVEAHSRTPPIPGAAVVPFPGGPSENVAAPGVAVTDLSIRNNSRILCFTVGQFTTSDVDATRM